MPQLIRTGLFNRSNGKGLTHHMRGNGANRDRARTQYATRCCPERKSAVWFHHVVIESVKVTFESSFNRKRVMKRTVLTSLAMILGVLAGCTGISPGRSPSETYTFPVPYEQAYQSAIAMSEQCLRTVTQYPVISTINRQARTAQVAVTGLMDRARYAQVDIRAIDDKRTEVKITMWGESIWGHEAILSMRDSIEFGVPTCFSSMPTQQSVINR